MTTAQTGILAPLPAHSRYLSFNIVAATEVTPLRQLLTELRLDPQHVIGLGASLVTLLAKELNKALDKEQSEGLAGLKPFPCYSVNGIEIPSTPHALWIWLRGDDRGELLQQGHQLTEQLARCFSLECAVDGFKHLEGRDLTGYIDGTENPDGEDAVQAAFSHDPKLQGSSFVAVQQWQHNFERFNALSQLQQDHSIGRQLSDNEELDDAPESAHVKRTAQESFEPEAFILRRSLPWSDAQGSGLMFIAFCHSLAPFEAQLERMIGLEDGISDALFQFTQPINGSYYWCPALKQGRLDLAPIGA